MKFRRQLSRAAIFRLVALALILLSACQTSEPVRSSAAAGQKKEARAAQQETAAAPVSADFEPPVRLATLAEAAIAESSGLVASRLDENLFWTHNDSGDAPFLYAFDREGRRRGTWRVEGAQARDWEDIAAALHEGRSYLYIGDIGDNHERRAQITVYRVPEPHLASAASEDASEDAARSSRPQLTEPAETFNLRYPDGSHDAETLLVHPQSGDLYIVTKTTATAATVYKASAPLDASRLTTLVRVGDVRSSSIFGGLLTGGDIAPDGRHVALCDYIAGYEFRLPASAGSFDDIWNTAPVTINLGERLQGEAVCYSLDGDALFATSEKRPAALFEVRRRDK